MAALRHIMYCIDLSHLISVFLINTRTINKKYTYRTFLDLRSGWCGGKFEAVQKSIKISDPSSSLIVNKKRKKSATLFRLMLIVYTFFLSSFHTFFVAHFLFLDRTKCLLPNLSQSRGLFH